MCINFCWFMQVKFSSPGEKKVAECSYGVLLQYYTYASGIYPTHQARVWSTVATQARSYRTKPNCAVQ